MAGASDFSQAAVMPSSPLTQIQGKQGTLKPATTAVAQDRAEADVALDYDVVIVGGGLVGLTLACALRHAGLRLAVIEAQPRSLAVERGQAYNLSQMTQRIFEQIGVWSAMQPQLTPYRQIRLSDADFGQVVTFTPADLGAGQEILGHVGEHRVVLAALRASLAESPQVTLLCPVEVIERQTEVDHARLTLRQAGREWQVRSQLVVAADGGRSPLRHQAGITTLGWPYWQSCIVALIQPELPHQNIAYERFWPSGPFAILPLPNNLCRIVWTAPKAEAQEIMAWDEARFMAELSRRYGDQMGQLQLVGERSLFQVQLLHSRRYVQPRFVLIGDAAHCCHPVGGQGVNMGFRDAAALAEVLLTALKPERGKHPGPHQAGPDLQPDLQLDLQPDLRPDLGDLALLQRYQRWRQWENLLILGVTDLLDRTFSNRILPVVGVRRLGLLALRYLPPVRTGVLRLMNGLVGRAPHLPVSAPPPRPEA